jgi:hypothetical protein
MLSLPVAVIGDPALTHAGARSPRSCAAVADGHAPIAVANRTTRFVFIRD